MKIIEGTRVEWAGRANQQKRGTITRVDSAHIVATVLVDPHEVGVALDQLTPLPEHEPSRKLFTEVNSEEGFGIKFTGTRKEANDYINDTIGKLVQLSTRDVFTPTERIDISASLRQVAGFFEKTIGNQ